MHLCFSPSQAGPGDPVEQEGVLYRRSCQWKRSDSIRERITSDITVWVSLWRNGYVFPAGISRGHGGRSHLGSINILSSLQYRCCT